MVLVEQNVAFGLSLVDTAHLMQTGVVVHSAPVDELDESTLATHLGIGKVLQAATGSALAARQPSRPEGRPVPVVERPDGARDRLVRATAPDDAPPVLLVMGLAYPAAMWFRLLPGLAERYRVLRVDNRGAGLTGDVPGAPYTVETMTADCLAVLDAAGVEQAHVVGISMGGLMAQELALTAPQRVRSLCLDGDPPRHRARGHEPQRCWRPGHRRAGVDDAPGGG